MNLKQFKEIWEKLLSTVFYHTIPCDLYIIYITLHCNCQLKISTFYVIFRYNVYMDYTDFWIRTNSLIKQLNKTQRGLSVECGFTERRIETLSSNCRSPDVIESVKIAKALNTTVEYLVTGETENQSEKELTELKAKLADLIMFK